jgi:Trk K+ transport system NAD-binding subunit
VRVAAVELRESNPFVDAARRLGVSVLVADTRLPSTLDALHVERAACLIAATDDDVANLQTALNARTICKDLRIVMRLFEADFAERVQRTFKIDACHSVSALAAPSFAAAATGLPVVATLPVGATALVVARITIAAASGLDSRRVLEVEQASGCRILFGAKDGQSAGRPPLDALLRAGQEIMVVGDPDAMTELWAQNRLQAVPGEGQIG